MRQEPLLQRGAFVDEPREKTRSTRRWRCKARACYAQRANRRPCDCKARRAADTRTPI